LSDLDDCFVAFIIQQESDCRHLMPVASTQCSTRPHSCSVLLCCGSFFENRNFQLL